MLSAIASAIGHIANPTGLYSNPPADIFEAYVWSLVVKAARIEGASMSIKDCHGVPAPNLLFRTSPGQIYSVANDFTHAELQFNGKPPLEAHVGIFVGGKSRVVHEADVLVVRKEEADFCRLRRIPPKSSKTLLAIECKYYVSLLQLQLAREFLGLVSDLASKNCFFVTNTSSASVERLLAYQGKNWERDIAPVNASEIERLVNAFRSIFKNYKAI